MTSDERKWIAEAEALLKKAERSMAERAATATIAKTRFELIEYGALSAAIKALETV